MGQLGASETRDFQNLEGMRGRLVKIFAARLFMTMVCAECMLMHSAQLSWFTQRGPTSFQKGSGMGYMGTAPNLERACLHYYQPWHHLQIAVTAL